MKFHAMALLLPVLFLSFSGRTEEQPVTRRIIINPNTTPRKRGLPPSLSESGNYFAYGARRFIRLPGTVSLLVDQVCRRMPMMEKIAVELLSKDGEIQNFIELPAWGAVYANLPRLSGRPDIVDQNTPVYALALLFVQRYDEAAESARKGLELKPDDYGATILLGLLSTRKKEYFPYLEKAFAVNPVKSIRLVDWHCDNLDMLAKLPEEWDFIDAYIRLLTRYRHVLKGGELSQITATRLLDAIRKTCFDGPHHVKPEYADIETELMELERRLIPSLQPAKDAPVLPASTGDHGNE